MVDGDKDEATWLQLLPDVLEEASSYWNEQQPPSVKSSWKVLMKMFVTENSIQGEILKPTRLFRQCLSISQRECVLT